MFPSANQTLVVQATNPETLRHRRRTPTLASHRRRQSGGPLAAGLAPRSPSPAAPCPGQPAAPPGAAREGRAEAGVLVATAALTESDFRRGKQTRQGRAAAAPQAPTPPGRRVFCPGPPRPDARLCKLIRRHVCLIYSSYSIKCVPCFYMKCIVRELICQMCASLPRRGTTFLTPLSGSVVLYENKVMLLGRPVLGLGGRLFTSHHTGQRTAAAG